MTDATVAASGEAGVVTIRVSGEIDLANAVRVEWDLLRSVENTATEAVVDLSEIGYLDSAGLRILFSFAARLETRQHRAADHRPGGVAGAAGPRDLPATNASFRSPTLDGPERGSR